MADPRGRRREGEGQHRPPSGGVEEGVARSYVESPREAASDCEGTPSTHPCAHSRGPGPLAGGYTGAMLGKGPPIEPLPIGPGQPGSPGGCPVTPSALVIRAFYSLFYLYIYFFSSEATLKRKLIRNGFY